MQLKTPMHVAYYPANFYQQMIWQTICHILKNQGNAEALAKCNMVCTVAHTLFFTLPIFLPST